MAGSIKFDKFVSIGMLEHFGRPNYELFFNNVDLVLKDQGLFLLHYQRNKTNFREAQG